MKVLKVSLFFLGSLTLCFSQSASQTAYIKIKNSPEKLRAVFVGENHAVKEYNQFSLELFSKLAEEDSTDWIYFYEFPKAANFLLEEYFNAGKKESLKAFKDVVLSRGGYKYEKEHFATLIKKIEILIRKKKKIRLQGIDLIGDDEMTFQLIKRTINWNPSQKFPVSAIDSLFRLKIEIKLDTAFYFSLIDSVSNKQSAINAQYGAEASSKIISLIKENRSKVTTDRDELMSAEVETALQSRKTILFFQSGLAHITRLQIPGKKRLYDMLLEKQIVTQKETVRIILCSQQKKMYSGSLMPEVTTVQYGLNSYNLKGKNFELIPGTDSSIKIQDEKNRVDYFVLYKSVKNLLIREH